MEPNKSKPLFGLRLGPPEPTRVPDAGKVDDPESRDRQTLEGNDAIRLALGQHVDVFMRAKDSDNAPRLLLDFEKGSMDLLQNRCGPGSE